MSPPSPLRRCLAVAAVAALLGAGLGAAHAAEVTVSAAAPATAYAVPTGTPVLRPVSAVGGGPNTEDGQKFIDFIVSPAGQAVLAKYGFGKP